MKEIDLNPAACRQLQQLTDKQHEVLSLLADGRTSKEMARELGVSASAVNQRVEALRQRLGGVSRAELGRLYRAMHTADEGEACNKFTGNSLQLPDQAFDHNTSFSDGYPDRLHLSDSMKFREEAPWNGRRDPDVVPRMLDGKSAGWFRMAAIAIIVVGMFAALTLVLAVAQGLTEMTGGSDPGSHESQ